MRKLLQRIKIGVLKALGGRIGRRHAQTPGACNRADVADVAAPVLGKVAEGPVDQAHKARDVGVDRVELDFAVQNGVLAADAGAVNVKLHAAQLVDELGEVVCRLLASDVDHANVDALRRPPLELLELFKASAGNAHLPAFFNQPHGGFVSNAGGGPHDHSLCHCLLPFCLFLDG